MSSNPPDPDELFLIALWDHLDAASSMSVGNDVLSCLDEIERYCRAVIELIDRRRAGAKGAG